jgi:hypothetical protein
MLLLTVPAELLRIAGAYCDPYSFFKKILVKCPGESFEPFKGKCTKPRNGLEYFKDVGRNLFGFGREEKS